MCADSVKELRSSQQQDKDAADVEQRSKAAYVVSLEGDSPNSPADGETADKGSLDGSQAAGAGNAAGEGSPGGSQAASGSDEEGDRWPQGWRDKLLVKEEKEADFAHKHHLPILGMLASSGRSSLSRGLIV